MKSKGSIIALAWPETKVIQEDKWYDLPMRLFGFLKDGYYTAGHAALILVNHDTLEFKYFDFGRYHTPIQKGRVRSYDTDPELKLNTKAIIESDKIVNIEELMTELQAKKACHGDGKLLASVYHNIDLDRAKAKTMQMQNKGAICYGPIKIRGTNCSRFVNQVAKYATKSLLKKILLNIPYTVSASPKFNIRMINSESHYYVMLTKKNNISAQSSFLIESVW